MTNLQIAPYGSWRSPITADLVSSGAVSISSIELDGNDIYWSEGRPAERGRSVIVRRTQDGQITDVTPAPFNARSTVHEYGGGAFAVADRIVYFSNMADQRLYRQAPDAAPQPITPEDALRYADGIVDTRRGRIICVCEDHRAEGEPVNTLVAVDLAGTQPVTVLIYGNDFYSTPRLSPDGMYLTWLTWNHPNMPWDGTELWVGKVAQDGTIAGARQVAGGANESIFQPAWSPDGTLYFVSDRSGWWNLYRLKDEQVVPVVEMAAEFGVPQWVFRAATYGFESADRILCVVARDGTDRLASINTTSGELTWIETPYSRIASPRVAPGRIVFIGASPTTPASVVQLDLARHQFTTLRRSSHVEIDPDYLSIPQTIDFPTEGERIAHAFFYPPRNRDFTAPPGELPPLLVLSHGGPTSATSTSFDLEIQYWTSRGFAVLDVNYGGSTGYGRAYRERLNRQWGVVDVDDCVNGALFLVEEGLVDTDRLAIRGGSAGGYTTLCALTFRDVFKAGTSYYGVSDLELLDQDTHKFESRYNYRLVGPYPEQRDLYYARSPIHFVDRLSCPMIFFQGLEDKVVPPNQTEVMVEALRAKGLPVAYLAFEGEGHGFRRAETIKRTLEAELYFYMKYLLWPDQPLPQGVEETPLE